MHITYYFIHGHLCFTILLSKIYNDRCSYFVSQMYDLTGDSTTIFTGSDDVSKSGTIDNYNGRPYLPHWPSPPCNKVSGSSDGTKFPSMSSNDTEVLFFSKTICRAIPMVRTYLLLESEDPKVIYFFFFME